MLYHRVPVVAAVELFPFGVSVWGLKLRKNCPKTSTTKGCINTLMLYLAMFPDMFTQSGKVCKLFQWPGKFPAFLEKYLFGLTTN